MTRTSVPYVGYLFVVIVAVVLYAGGLNGPYFADDFQFVFDNPAALVENCLTLVYPPGEYDTSFYRPFQTCFLLHVQAAAGLNTVPIHSVHLLLHVLVSCMVCWAVFRFTGQRWPAVVAGLTMAASQGNVLAVASNDTLSQLLATLFGVSALALFAVRRPTAAHARSLRDWALYLLALLLLSLSLLSKETSVCFALLAAGITVMSPTSSRTWGRWLVRIAVEVAPIVLVTLCYLAFRDSLHARPPQFGNGIYEFRFGLNVVKNVATLWFSTLHPLSSVDAYMAVAQHRVMAAGLYLTAAATWVGILGWGVIRSRTVRAAAWLAMAAMVAMVPTAFMNHVSELYTYNCMPFVAAIVGLAFGPLLETGGGVAEARRRAAIVVGVALLLSHGLAVQSKVRMMTNNGIRAAELVSAVVAAAKKAPAEATLRLIGPKPAGPSYSVFRMYGFQVLQDAGDWIRTSSGRLDLKVLFVDWDEAWVPAPGWLCLTIENNRVVPMPVY